ncbi:MAG: glycoside hydrolase family 9 protein, partial [bacterium]
PKSSAATIDAASMLAHAALVYQRFPEFTDYANECRTRAISAWNYFRSNPMNDGITSGKDGPSGGDKDTTAQIQDSVVTAIYLYALTNNTVYNNYIKQHYQQTRPMKDVWWGWGLYDNWQSQALMYYTTLPNADATVKTAIQNGKTYSGSYSWIGWNDNLDLYRGYMPDGQYHWGSNMVKADVGNSLMEFVAYNILPQHKNQYLNHALEVLHNFHGVNPMGLTYITSMEPYGGDSCAHYMYHQWYLTAIVPAGYIPGGPNSSYAPDPSYSGPPLEPPQNQPPQKSYKDWGNTWPENSWEVTEPSISYQAEYVLLLSFFAQEKNTPTSVIDWYLY